jgi:cytochrome P450
LNTFQLIPGPRVNANAHKHCFWIIAYLLQDPELQESVRRETSEGISGDQINVPFLVGDCPLLNAVFDEVLRITNASNSIRYIAKDTTIGGLKLRKGANVLMPSRQLSFDESAFGADPHSFNPERFLKDKYLRRSPSFRPFGGGTTYCPGRYITRQETVVFVALILNRFEIRLPDGVGSHEIPALDELRPSLGIMSPANGVDIVVEVKERK